MQFPNPTEFEIVFQKYCKLELLKQADKFKQAAERI